MTRRIRRIRRIATGRIAAGLLAVSMLAGCANQGQLGTGQIGGGVLGGAAGGIAGGAAARMLGMGSGGETLLTIAGAVLGAGAGSDIGRRLYDEDRRALGQASQQAFEGPVGSRVAWAGETQQGRTGHSGTVETIRAGTDTTTGAACREFRSTIYIDGRAEQQTGIACRRPDGTWAAQS
jgi:surface antigen